MKLTDGTKKMTPNTLKLLTEITTRLKTET